MIIITAPIGKMRKTGQDTPTINHTPNHLSFIFIYKTPDDQRYDRVPTLSYI